MLTLLYYNGFKYIRHVSSKDTTYWRCKFHHAGCYARIITRYRNDCEMIKIQYNRHNHDQYPLYN